jgi:hypothetical protein
MRYHWGLGVGHVYAHGCRSRVGKKKDDENEVRIGVDTEEEWSESEDSMQQESLRTGEDHTNSEYGLEEREDEDLEQESEMEDQDAVDGDDSDS